MKVSVEKCEDYDSIKLREVLLKSLDNIDFEFVEGSRVLIKPNVLGANEPEKGVTTHPAILEELCKILKEHHCEIYIGDSSFADTEHALEVSGITQLSKYGKVLDFDKEPFKTFEIQNKKINIPKILLEVDLVINFAKIKTHMFTGVTLCSKNLYGCIPGKLKGYLHKSNQTHEKLSEILIGLNDIIKPQLNFIDGIIGIEGNGPGTGGDKINAGLVLASKNIFAVDIIGTEIMGFDINSIGTNKLSGIDRDDIEVVGVNVDEVKIEFKRSSNHMQSALVFLNKFFPSPRIGFDNELCQKCHICERQCPVKVISLETLDGFPVCKNKDCILCFCCVETCPHKAVLMKDHWSKKSARYTLELPGKIFRKIIKKKELFEDEEKEKISKT
jgi:uncharacterized protein (DUF362 family)/NAD-dependent dihydropyrimidine dehydrogenase PreA subunit